jgi:hypothetical protein
MVRVGIAVVLVIALMPMAWASPTTYATLTYSGETTNDSLSLPNFAPHENTWDYCYTLTWWGSDVAAGNTWSIVVPVQPSDITVTGSVTNANNWTSGYAGNVLTFTAGNIPIPTTGSSASAYFQFWSSAPPNPNGANPPLKATFEAGPTFSGTYWTTTIPLITGSSTQLYTNPEPGTFALGAIVLGMAGSLWRRRPRRKSAASTPPTDL